MSLREKLRKVKSSVGGSSVSERTGAVSGLMLLGLLIGVSSAMQDANALKCDSTKGDVTATDASAYTNWSNSWYNHSWCWTWSWCWSWSWDASSSS